MVGLSSSGSDVTSRDQPGATGGGSAPPRLLRPPGVWLYVATVLAIAVAIDANSRQSLVTFFLALPIWVAVAVAWTIRFVAAIRSPSELSGGDLVRWLAIPAAMGAIFFLTRTDVLFDARFGLSREALDTMAAEVMSGESTDRGWVGLYNVGPLERTANGVRFVVDDSGLYRLGFAYSPGGQPELTEANFDPLWCCTSYEPRGGGWWLWTEEWD